jgi:hypothetical protein
VQSGEWKRVAVYAAEAYGIFTIGEMIGRRHMVGYVDNSVLPVPFYWQLLNRAFDAFRYKLD